MSNYIFADNLSQIMKKRGVTPGFLADMAGLYINSVRYYTTARQNPKLSTIASFCDILDIMPADLFAGVIGETELDDMAELYGYLTGDPSAKLPLVRANTESLAKYFATHQVTLKGVGFGKRLKSVREDACLTVKELAESCGVSESRIWSMESGPSLPSFDRFILLCNALRVSPDFLMRDMLTEKAGPYDHDPIMNMVAGLTPKRISVLAALARNIMTK